MSSLLSRIQRLSPTTVRSVVRSVAEARDKQRTSSSSSSRTSSSRRRSSSSSSSLPIGAGAGASAGVQIGSPTPETPPKSSRTIEQVINPSPSTSIRPGDVQRDPFQITTTARTPSTRTYTRTVTLPKQDKAEYTGAEYKDVKVDPVKTQFGLREVFTSTPESRREYVRTRKDYNIKATDYNKQARESIEAQKKEVAKYNKAVDEWNKKGRFQKQTVTQEYFPSTTRIEYPEVTFQRREPTKLTTDEIRAKLFKPEALDKKQTPSIISMPKQITQSILSQTKPSVSGFPSPASEIIMPQDARISTPIEQAPPLVPFEPVFTTQPYRSFKQKLESSLEAFTSVLVTRSLAKTRAGRESLAQAGIDPSSSKSGFDAFTGGSPILSASIQASVPRISDASEWLRNVSTRAEEDFVRGKRLTGEYTSPIKKYIGQQSKLFTMTTTRLASIPVGLLDISAQVIDKPVRTIPVIAGALPSLPKSLVQEAKAYPRGFATELAGGFLFDSFIGSPVGRSVRTGVRRTTDLIIQPEQVVKRTPFETEGFKFITQSGRQIDVSLTPPGKKPRLGVDLDEFLKVYGSDIKRRTTPEMPTNLSSTQRRILSVVRETDSVVGGGLARNIVLDPSAVRKFLPTSDLDIGVRDVTLFKRALRTEFGQDVAFKNLGMSTQVSIKGKPFADLVDLAVFEGRKLTLEKFPDVMLGKLRVASPEALIVGKAKSLTVGVQPKSIKDIISGLGSTPQITEALSGAKTRGGFGWSFAEQGKYIGQSVDVISGQSSPGLTKFFSDGFKEALNPTQLRRIRKHFFASPDSELRISRTGSAPSGQQYTSIWDVLRGKAEFGGLTAGSEIFFMEKAPVSKLTPRLRKLYEKAKLYEKGDTKFLKEYQDFWREYSVFQETRTGTFKPFGQPSGEIEFTLAPTEIQALLGGTPRLARTTRVRIGDQLIPLYEFKIAPRDFVPPKATIKKGFVQDFLDDSLNLLKSEKGFVEPLAQRRVVSPRRLTAPSPDIQATKQLERNIRYLQRTSSDPIRIRPTYTPEALTSDVLSGFVTSPRKAIPSGMVSPRRLTATGSTGARPRSPEPSTSLITKGTKSPFTFPRTSDSATITTSRTDPSSTITYESITGTPSTITSETSTTTSTSLLAPPTYTPSGISDPPSPELTNLIPTPPTRPPRRRTKPTPKRDRVREVNLEDTWIPEYRSKGKWKPIKVDNQKRNYYSAKQLGAYIVDHSAERSFRLRKGQGKADIIKTTRPSIMHKFYKNSKTGNPRLTGAWIEESKYAIDTAGERQGITAKGLVAMERKRKQEKFKPFLTKPKKSNLNKKRGNGLINKLLR